MSFNYMKSINFTEIITLVASLSTLIVSLMTFFYKSNKSKLRVAIDPSTRIFMKKEATELHLPIVAINESSDMGVMRDVEVTIRKMYSFGVLSDRKWSLKWTSVYDNHYYEDSMGKAFMLPIKGNAVENKTIVLEIDKSKSSYANLKLKKGSYHLVIKYKEGNSKHKKKSQHVFSVKEEVIKDTGKKRYGNLSSDYVKAAR